MLKKLIVLICAVALIGTQVIYEPVFADSARSYELWVQSPMITSGITDDELKIYKAMDQNQFELYPLPQVGSNYYLGICEAQMRDGGWNGNSKTSYLYYYTLLMTNDSFIILSKASARNEYYWDRGHSFTDISSQINPSYYTSRGYEVPCYILNPIGKYGNTNYTEYDEYLFVTKSGKIYLTAEDADDGCEGYPFIYSGVLYRGQDRYYSSSRYYYYYMPDGYTQATQYKPYYFNNGAISYGTTTNVPVSSVTAANGYTLYKEGFNSNVVTPAYYKIPDTTDLYISVSQPYIYDQAAERSYYYQQIDVYRCVNGIMTLFKTKTFPTTYTYTQTLTPTSLGTIDSTFYTSKGYSVPKIIIGKSYVILQDGTIGAMSLDSATYAYWEFSGYNNRLVVIRNCNGSSYLRWADENGVNQYWQNLNYIYFDSSGTMIKESDISLKVVSGGNAGQNGYYYSYSTFNSPNFSALSLSPVKSWWGRCRSNVFPDGRRVVASWMGMGNSMYEIWYTIYNADGSVCATGPTGYSTTSSSMFDTMSLIAFAVNNSKFLVSINEVDRDWSKEYYRIAVAEESDNGEVIGGSGSIGTKNILPPDTTDTEPIQNSIDFGQNDLPLGYNIKDNVINSGKLESGLRQQVNTVRLNDIVILKKSGYVSGIQNTGVNLPTYSNYDYSFGSSYIRMYSNGQNFQWYCYNPESLTVGTYNKTYYIGDKAVYVTVKVILAPSNSGSATVVF